MTVTEFEKIIIVVKSNTLLAKVEMFNDKELIVGRIATTGGRKNSFTNFKEKRGII